MGSTRRWKHSSEIFHIQICSAGLRSCDCWGHFSTVSSLSCSGNAQLSNQSFCFADCGYGYVENGFNMFLLTVRTHLLSFGCSLNWFFPLVNASGCPGSGELDHSMKSLDWTTVVWTLDDKHFSLFINFSCCCFIYVFSLYFSLIV